MSTYKIDAIDFVHAANSTVSGAAIVSKILVLCNGNIFLGNYGSWSGVGSSLYNSSASELSTVAASQKFYIVDGTAHTSGSLIQLNAIDSSVGRVATGGTGQPPSQARLVTLYRNRLVLTRTETDPYDWFMSAAGAYTTFDYADETSTGAVAGNNSVAGKIGDIITCLIPVNDDYMIMGCQDSVWLMRGDPKSGGRIDNLSWGGGIVGPSAWARDPEGNVYYCSRTDLMVIPPGGGTPQSITQGKLQKFFDDIDFSTVTVRMAFDAQKKQLFTFFVKSTATVTTHLMWDKRMDAFSTMTFPAIYGPTAVRALTGETLQTKQLLMGNFTGQIWTFAPTWISDNGVPIDSAIKFAPIPLAGPGDRGIIREVQFVVGDGHNVPSMNWEAYVDDSAQDADTLTTPTNTEHISAIGRHVNRQRARGNSAIFRISGASTLGLGSWSFEQGHMYVEPGGDIK